MEILIRTFNLMCNINKMDILSRGRYSMIYKSTSCECINVTLANVNVHLDRHGFEDFSNLLEQSFDDLFRNEDCKKVCCIDTPYPGITFHFSKDELEDLLETIVEARLKIELSELI